VNKDYHRRLATLQITSSQPLIELILLRAVVVYDLLTWTVSLCLAAGPAQHVRLLGVPHRRPGILELAARWT